MEGTWKIVTTAGPSPNSETSSNMCCDTNPPPSAGTCRARYHSAPNAECKISRSSHPCCCQSFLHPKWAQGLGPEEPIALLWASHCCECGEQTVAAVAILQPAGCLSVALLKALAQNHRLHRFKTEACYTAGLAFPAGKHLPPEHDCCAVVACCFILLQYLHLII